MSRPEPSSDRPDGGEREPGGTMQPTSPRVLVVLGVLGLVLGWSLRPVTASFGWTPPFTTWGQPIGLLLVGAVVGGTAWLTRRSVQGRQERLLAHEAVNRLVLGRACALVGALVAGLYGGYAVSWLGLEAELLGPRFVRAGAAALSGLVICAAGLLLERACRVGNADRAP